MLTNIGTSLGEAGQVESALDYQRRAAEACRALGDPRAQSLVLSNLAASYIFAGQYANAAKVAEEAVAEARSVGDTLTEADALDELGQARSGLGAHAEAIGHFQSALETYRSIDHPFEAPTLHHLARAHLASGHPGRARETLRRALVRANELGDPLADPGAGRAGRSSVAHGPEVSGLTGQCQPPRSGSGHGPDTKPDHRLASAAALTALLLAGVPGAAYANATSEIDVRGDATPSLDVTKVEFRYDAHRCSRARPRRRSPAGGRVRLRGHEPDPVAALRPGGHRPRRRVADQHVLHAPRRRPGVAQCSGSKVRWSVAKDVVILSFPSAASALSVARS